MTSRMTAAEQKKRLNPTYTEQCRPVKKPRLHSSSCLISLKSQIGLEWDYCEKRIVPKREQVGILWSDLAPFVESSPKHCSGLADVTYFPPETFSLENLRGVLSYEVWSICLTEAEKKFLIQFLPSEADAEENVHLLLSGKNYHFKNPSLSWSSSICYGDIHPDAVLNKEKQVRADEKAYRINLLNYHSNMVETLKKWREGWLNCDDLENLLRDNPAKQKHGEMRSEAAKSEVPLKVTYNNDVSKFMSYIEISKTQHNLIKSLKQSGDGIQTKHLTRVIGGLEKFDVKPYGTLIEDEQRRLCEHWLTISCNDLPAAFEVRRDRKMLIEKLRKLLGIDLGEKNISVTRKTDQLADIIKEPGHVCGNDDNPDSQNGQVELLPQDVLHSGDDHSPSLEDRDDEENNYIDTSIERHDEENNYIDTSIERHENLNLKDEDLMIVNGTGITSQSHSKKYDVQDQDHKDISCTDKAITFSVNNPDEQNEYLTRWKFSNDEPQVHVEDTKEISYTDTINDHSSESKQIDSISYTSKPVHTLHSHHMQAQDLQGIAYTGPSIHAHELDQGLKCITYATTNGDGHVVNNVSPAKSHPEMNVVILDQEDSENIGTVVASNSSSLHSKSEEQFFENGFLDSNDQAGKCEKDVWHLPGPLYCHPAENSMHSGDLQIKHMHHSAGQQDSIVYLENGILSRQQAQVTVASAFPMVNSASFMQPCPNRQSNSQLQAIAEDTGMPPYYLERRDVNEQSTDLDSLVNNHLAQCTPFPTPMQAHQLIDGRQQIQKNLYSGARFPTKGNPPIVEQQSFATSRPLGHRYNWFPEEQQSHNNWSGMELDNCLNQNMPGGSNTDGSLFSVLAQYKEPSVHMQSAGRLGPSQRHETGNQVHPAQSFAPRTRDTNTRVPNMYGYTQNLPTNQSSHLASIGSLNSMQWTNFIQQNPGMPDLSRQFRGPWTK